MPLTAEQQRQKAECMAQIQVAVPALTADVRNAYSEYVEACLLSNCCNKNEVLETLVDFFKTFIRACRVEEQSEVAELCLTWHTGNLTNRWWGRDFNHFIWHLAESNACMVDEIIHWRGSDATISLNYWREFCANLSAVVRCENGVIGPITVFAFQAMRNVRTAGINPQEFSTVMGNLMLDRLATTKNLRKMAESGAFGALINVYRKGADRMDQGAIDLACRLSARHDSQESVEQRLRERRNLQPAVTQSTTTTTAAAVAVESQGMLQGILKKIRISGRQPLSALQRSAMEQQQPLGPLAVELLKVLQLDRNHEHLTADRWNQLCEVIDSPLFSDILPVLGTAVADDQSNWWNQSFEDEINYHDQPFRGVRLTVTSHYLEEIITEATRRKNLEAMHTSTHADQRFGYARGADTHERLTAEITFKPHHR